MSKPSMTHEAGGLILEEGFYFCVWTGLGIHRTAWES
jgi:hypothetical protein